MTLEILGTHTTTGAEAIRNTLRLLVRRGRLVESRHGDAYELTNYTICVDRGAATLVERAGFDQRLAVAEALHLISGLPYGRRIQEITAHLDSERWASARPSFARRLRDDLPVAVWKLTRDPGTRQAVLPIWHPGDLGSGNEDYLCATGLQFLLRGRLNLTVNWRSNDAWHGLPYNLFAFGQLLATMAHALGVTPGALTFHVGSAHLYVRHADRARLAAEKLTSGPEIFGVGVPQYGGDPQLRWLALAARASAMLRGAHLDNPTVGEESLLELLG